MGPGVEAPDERVERAGREPEDIVGACTMLEEEVGGIVDRPRRKRELLFEPVAKGVKARELGGQKRTLAFPEDEHEARRVVTVDGRTDGERARASPLEH